MAPGHMGESHKGVGSWGRGRREPQRYAVPGLPESHLFAALGLSRLPGSFKAGPHLTLPGSVLGAAPLSHSPFLLPPLSHRLTVLDLCPPASATHSLPKLGFAGPVTLPPGSSAPFPSLELAPDWPPSASCEGGVRGKRLQTQSGHLCPFHPLLGRHPETRQPICVPPAALRMEGNENLMSCWNFGLNYIKV